MARIDDYHAAKKIAVETLSKKPLAGIAKQSGFDSPTDPILQIPFLDRVYRVAYPEFEFVDEADSEKAVPIQEQVLILHYLLPEQISEPSGTWVAYREIPGGAFYFSAFVKRAVDPLKKVFGQNVDGLTRASKHLGGRPVEPGDAAYEFLLFPKMPLRLTVWAGDDEFSPEANILFDDTAGKILSPEDLAWLAGMLVYRLISLSSQ